jgi:histidinol-phosphate aminotransferase
LRQRLSDALTQLGFCVVPSEANFILILFDGAACSADQADTALKENGFIVRRMESYGLDNALRITIGREPDVEKIISIFEGVVT